MAATTSWHRYGTKLRHCHPVYCLFDVSGSFSAWQETSSNSSADVGDCVAITTVTSSWIQRDCAAPLSVICRTGDFTPAYRLAMRHCAHECNSVVQSLLLASISPKNYIKGQVQPSQVHLHLFSSFSPRFSLLSVHLLPFPAGK